MPEGKARPASEENMLGWFLALAMATPVTPMEWVDACDDGDATACDVVAASHFTDVGNRGRAWTLPRDLARLERGCRDGNAEWCLTVARSLDWNREVLDALFLQPCVEGDMTACGSMLLTMDSSTISSDDGERYAAIGRGYQAIAERDASADAWAAAGLLGGVSQQDAYARVEQLCSRDPAACATYIALSARGYIEDEDIAWHRLGLDRSPWPYRTRERDLWTPDLEALDTHARQAGEALLQRCAADDPQACVLLDDMILAASGAQLPSQEGLAGGMGLLNRPIIAGARRASYPMQANQACREGSLAHCEWVAVQLSMRPDIRNASARRACAQDSVVGCDVIQRFERRVGAPGDVPSCRRENRACVDRAWLRLHADGRGQQRLAEAEWLAMGCAARDDGACEALDAQLLHHPHYLLVVPQVYVESGEEPPLYRDVVERQMRRCRQDIGACDALFHDRTRLTAEEQSELIQHYVRGCRSAAPEACDRARTLIPYSETESLEALMEALITGWTTACDDGDVAVCIEAALASASGYWHGVSLAEREQPDFTAGRWRCRGDACNPAVRRLVLQESCNETCAGLWTRLCEAGAEVACAPEPDSGAACIRGDAIACIRRGVTDYRAREPGAVQIIERACQLDNAFACSLLVAAPPQGAETVEPCDDFIACSEACHDGDGEMCHRAAETVSSARHSPSHLRAAAHLMQRCGSDEVTCDATYDTFWPSSLAPLALPTARVRCAEGDSNACTFIERHADVERR